ncbi:MAG TPA: hypothetical protein VIK39_19205, partial [Candidatus Angelobacter sp.]
MKRFCSWSLIGYILIIFATGQVLYGYNGDGFDKTSGSKYFSNPDQHTHFFPWVLFEEGQGVEWRFLRRRRGSHSWASTTGLHTTGVGSMKKWYNYFVS